MHSPLPAVLLRYVMIWTGVRWGPDGITLAPAAHSKAAQLGQKLAMGLEAAYQVIMSSVASKSRIDYPRELSRRSSSPRTRKFLDLEAIPRNSWDFFLKGPNRFTFLSTPSATVCVVSRQTCAESCNRRARGDLSGVISPEMWKRFADGLARNGFFEEELEGSKRYREKTEMAEVRCSERACRYWYPRASYLMGYLCSSPSFTIV